MQVGRGGVTVRGREAGITVGSSDLGHSWGGDHLSGNGHGLAVDDGIESVDGIGSVLDGTTGAIGLHEGVGSLDDVSAAALLLSLVVSGQSVLDVVAEAVLGVGIVVIDDGLGDNWGGVFGNCGISIGSHSNLGDGWHSIGGVSGRRVRVDGNSGSAGHEGGEKDNLRRQWFSIKG